MFSIHRGTTGLARRALTAGLVTALLWIGCSEETDPLARTVGVSGKVTNSSAQSGTIIVQIQYNLRDVADSEGRYTIMVHRDFYIDSLYAYVDVNGNGQFDQTERYGFYRSGPNAIHATPIHVRSSDINNIDITIY